MEPGEPNLAEMGITVVVVRKLETEKIAGNITEENAPMGSTVNLNTDVEFVINMDTEPTSAKRDGGKVNPQRRKIHTGTREGTTISDEKEGEDINHQGLNGTTKECYVEKFLNYLI